MHPNCLTARPAVLLSACLSVCLAGCLSALGAKSWAATKRGTCNVAPSRMLRRMLHYLHMCEGGARAEAGQRLDAASIKRGPPTTGKGIGCWAIGECCKMSSNIVAEAKSI